MDTTTIGCGGLSIRSDHLEDRLQRHRRGLIVRLLCGHMLSRAAECRGLSEHKAYGYGCQTVSSESGQSLPLSSERMMITISIPLFCNTESI